MYLTVITDTYVYILIIGSRQVSSATFSRDVCGRGTVRFRIENHICTPHVHIHVQYISVSSRLIIRWI